ncbi:acyltransferase [Bradyrhizobium sp. B024]|uniref:acyltransferase family protein n=1 Tax=Bradyrhizobium sp. B024 TaxID=3140247 RepID=UPI003183AF25
MRLSFLDSIRGIASLIVVTSHLHFTAGPETRFLNFYGLRFFNQSAFAVMIFFVLSGLVLYLQAEGENINYLRFVVRRAFRIFPACIFAISLSYAIYLLWNPAPLASRGWFNDVSWPAGITFDSYLHHLLLDGADSLLRPIWSLVIEWRVSLIFPALLILFAWSPRMAAILAIATAIIIPLLPASVLTAGAFEIQGRYFYTAFFVPFFMAGVFIAAYRFQIVLLLRRTPLLRYAMLAVCIYYLCFRAGDGSLSDQLALGLVGCALIAFCMSDFKARSLLRTKSLRYIGRISYSLYLVHMIWIGILFRLLNGTNPLVISAIVIAASILSADLMNRFIEVPANRFGRRVADLIRWPASSAHKSQSRPA